MREKGECEGEGEGESEYERREDECKGGGIIERLIRY